MYASLANRICSVFYIFP